MKKQLLLTLLCVFMVSLRSLAQIDYPSGNQNNFMTLPPLSGSNNYYDVCYAGLIGDFNFDIGSVAPATLLISVPKGTCLLDNSLALLGTYQSSSTYYDDYEISGLTANSNYSFKVDLSAVDCQFFSVSATEPVRVKVFDGIGNTTLTGNPVPINRPSFSFTAVTPNLTGLLKGSTHQRTYKFTAFQNADYNNFLMDVSVENELHIRTMSIRYLDDGQNQVGSVMTPSIASISCSDLPLNNGTYPGASYVHTAQNFQFHFSKDAGSNPDFVLPQGFEMDWSIEVTESFWVVTMSGTNDLQTEYSIKTECNTNPTVAVCSTRAACSSFDISGNMNANVPDPTTSACIGVFTGFNNGHTILDAYNSSNTDFYYGINVGGPGGAADARRFYGVRFLIDNNFFSIPAAGGIVSSSDMIIRSFDGTTAYTLATQPVISSVTIGTTQHISICFRNIFNGSNSGSDVDGAGPFTNVFFDPTRTAQAQYFGDLMPGNQILIEFKNIQFNAAASAGLSDCGEHFPRLFEGVNVYAADQKIVDLCITDDATSNRQVHRNQTYATCDPVLANWPAPVVGFAGINGYLANLFTQHFNGFTNVVSDNTDIVETINGPGQQDEVELTYTFTKTPNDVILTPWNIGGPPTGCTSSSLHSHYLDQQYGELYYAYVEVPDGFYITTVDGDVGTYTVPAAVSGCSIYYIPLTQANAEIRIKVKMSGCPGTSTCSTATNNQQTVGSGNSTFYLEFRSQLNKSTSNGVDLTAYYITYGCDLLTLYYHCDNLCSNPNIGVGIDNFSMARNSFGWTNLNAFTANPNTPNVTATTSGVTLDRVYLGDDIKVLSTNADLAVPASSTCTANNLNFEISYESPNGVSNVFVFTGGQLTFTEVNNPGNVVTLTLDANNQGTVWNATTAQPPGGGTTGWSYLTIQMSLADIPGNTGNTFSMKDLVNGLNSVTRSAVEIDLEGHYTLNCTTTVSLNPDYYYMGQIRAQFTADDGSITYGNPNPPGICFSYSCDPWGDAMTILILETQIQRGVAGWVGYAWLFSVNSGWQSPCAINVACEINVVGGFPQYTPDFPLGTGNEYRPIVRYPLNYNMTLSDNLYLSRAYMYWNYAGAGWGEPFSPASLPPWRKYLDLLDCSNTSCPTFNNGTGDPDHQGDPLHPGGLINFEYNTTTRQIAINGYTPSNAVAFPGNHTWLSYLSQQKGELRNFGFNLTRDCYFGQGTQFAITDFDLPLNITNSRSRSITPPTPLNCDATIANNSLMNVSFSYTNPANPTTPISFTPVGLPQGTTNYNTTGNLVTFCVDVNIYGAQNGWIYVEPEDPDFNLLEVSIVNIQFAANTSSCTPATSQSGIIQNTNGLWYFNCAQPGRLMITVSFECNSVGGSCAQCYGPTTIRFHYGFHCNRCVLAGLDPFDQDDFLELTQCGQHATYDLDFTPQIPQLYFSSPSPVNQAFCDAAEIEMTLYTYAGSNPIWGEIRHPHLRIYGPEGVTATLSSPGNNYVGSYVGVSPGGYYDFDLVNTLTATPLVLTFTYFPGCNNYPSTAVFSYSIYGDDGCDIPKSFTNVASTTINFEAPVPLADPVISWSGPQQLSCIDVGQYTVTVSNITDDGDLVFSVCLPSFIQITTSNPAYTNHNVGTNCYEWNIPVTGVSSQDILFDIASNTSAICSDFSFESYAQLFAECNTCPIQTQNIQEDYLVNICCSLPCSGVVIDLDPTIISNTQSGGNTGSITLNPTGGTAPYTYQWSTGATVNPIVNLYAGLYTVTVTDDNGCTATDVYLITEPCEGFRTQTQGGWGHNPAGGNPGAFLQANFGIAFPGGIEIGCDDGNSGTVTDHTLTFLQSSNITSFLPCGTTPAILTSTAVNPSCSSVQNVFASQVLALSISVGFDLALPNFGTATTHLEDLIYVEASNTSTNMFYGWTVHELLVEANALLGGCVPPNPYGTTYTISNLSDAIESINSCYIDGTQSCDYLSCSFEMGSLRVAALGHDGTNSVASVAKAVVRGGQAPYTYLWSNNSTDRSISNIPTGVYTVTVTDANNNTDVSSVNITGFSGTIYNLTPDFNYSFDVNAGTLSLFDASTSDCNITSYSWSVYPLEQTVSSTNPVFNYTAGGTYTVCLTVTSTCLDGQVYVRGICEDIELPGRCIAQSDFSRSGDGCTVSFNNLSTYFGPSVSYTWSFGDGTSFFGQTPPPHTYLSDGSYEVCLVTTVSGVINDIVYDCTDEVCKIINVRDCANPEPGCSVVAGFKVNLKNCAVYLSDLTTYSGDIISWTWDFGDGTVVIGQTPPPHLYAQPGTYTICLDIVVYDPETQEYCYDTYCEEVNVECDRDDCQIYPFFTYDTENCVVSFENLSLTNGNIVSWNWNFGDPSSQYNTSNAANPYHQYSSPGFYMVCLEVQVIFEGNLCIERYCMEIEVRDECNPCEVECGIEYVVEGCKLYSNAINTDPGSTIYWEFGDGSSGTGVSPVHTYALPGTYEVCMYVVGYVEGNLCLCTRCFEVNIENCNSEACEAQLEMEFEIAENCHVTFTDMTTTGSNTSILSWYWDFGDGYYSYNQSPQHTYMLPGNYMVCLKVTAWTGEEYCYYELCKEIVLEGCTFTRQMFSNSSSSMDAIRIIPNPSDGKFRIEFEATTEASSKITMLNSLGQVVLMKDYATTKGINVVEFDAGTFPKGVYIIKMNYGENYQIVRILLQ